LSNAEVELRNLNIAIKRLERERDEVIMKADMERKGTEAVVKRRLEERERAVREEYGSLCENYQKQVTALQEQIEEEALRRRKMEMDFAQEKASMQKGLALSLQKVQSSHMETVDKALITNLIVSYFRRKR